MLTMEHRGLGGVVAQRGRSQGGEGLAAAPRHASVLTAVSRPFPSEKGGPILC